MRAIRTATALSLAMIPFGTTAASATPPSDQPAREVIEFLDISRQVAPEDVGESSSAPHAGDVLAFHNLLRHLHQLDAATRQVLGRFPSRCVLGEGTLARCEGSLELRDGSISVEGTPDLAVTPIEMVVTGGTGRYAGVTGEARLTPTETPGTSLLTVHLQRP